MTKDKQIIDEQIVAKTAHLARLSLDPADCQQMQLELEKILENFSCLESIDTEGVKPAYHPFDQENHTREDTACLDDRRREWLAIAGNHKDGFLVVPRTVED